MPLPGGVFLVRQSRLSEGTFLGFPGQSPSPNANPEIHGFYRYRVWEAEIRSNCMHKSRLQINPRTFRVPQKGAIGGPPP